MKTELKAKFIQHLNRKQSDTGFTLVELLVVIIIIGILAAIALPNFLSQAAKAKQTEAKQNIGLVNRIQVAYRSENTKFADTFDALATGTLSGSTTFYTKSYTYSLAASQDTSKVQAGSADSALKLYNGGTVRFVNTQSQSVISSLICEAAISATGTGSLIATDITAKTATSAISCVAGYKSL